MNHAPEPHQPPTMDDIAARLQGYDPQALSVEAARAFILALAPLPRQTEVVPLFEALDRVLAQDVISPVSVPPHDNSAMDGFAFDGSELQRAGTSADTLQLQVQGSARAGAAWRDTLRPGCCVKITTGAVMPEGTDTVVPVELVQTEGDRVRFDPRRLQPGDNRRLMGEDLQQGRAALRTGTRLGPAALGLVASLGLAHVTVWRRLRVAYFSTGDEILSVGQPPRSGAVYDSNRYTVFGLLRRVGIEVVDLGVIPDEPARLAAAFRAGADADAIITSGGVSVGEADFTKAMMRELGDVVFWRIAMRPGRPMAVGRLRAPAASGAILFGLPGNPVAVMVTFLALVRPALLQMSGQTVDSAVLLQARSTCQLRKKPGRTEYQRGCVVRDATGQLVVTPVGNQGSGVLSSMVQANGLIVLAHDSSTVEPGEPVEVMMFDGVI